MEIIEYFLKFSNPFIILVCFNTSTVSNGLINNDSIENSIAVPIPPKPIT